MDPSYTHFSEEPSRERDVLRRPAAEAAVPPHDDQAEAGVLACVLEAGADADKFLDALEESHFSDTRHLIIFRALSQNQADGESINSVTLYQKLTNNGEIEKAGGIDYVTRLPLATHSPAHFPAFLDTVKDRAARREWFEEAAKMTREALDLSIPIAIKPKNELPQILDAACFAAVELPAPPQIIQGILHKGCKLAIGGGSKTYKTWNLIDLALSVAHGEPWLSIKTTSATVGIVNFELPDWAFQQRLLAVADAKNIRIQPGALHVWNLRGHAKSYTELLPILARELKERQLGLIVLDPIYKLYGDADENSARDVAALLNGLERLTKETGAAIAYGSHYSKGNQSGKEAMDRISGSGVFARDPDAILTYTKHQQDGAFTVDAILRNCPAMEPFVVQWVYPLFQVATDLDPAKLRKPPGRAKEHDPRELLRSIADTTPESPISISAWANKADIPRQTLTEYLLEMRRKGWVQTIGEGNKARQCITNDGKAFLNESRMPEIDSRQAQ